MVEEAFKRGAAEGPPDSGAVARHVRLRQRACLACGASFATPRAGAEFCRPACRQEFQNRRRERGAQLYDLFMALRFDRGSAKALGLWSTMCRLASNWREEDRRAREGRRSWARPRDALSRMVAATATVFRVR